MVLNNDDFVKSVKSIIGDRTDEESINFIENMTDTYNSLVADKDVTNTAWEQKYNALNETWSKRYKDRFLSGSDEQQNNDSHENDNEPKTYNDLFK